MSRVLSSHPVCHVLLCFGCMWSFAPRTADSGEVNAKGAKNLLVTLGRCWESPSRHCQLPPPIIKATQCIVPTSLTWPFYHDSFLRVPKPLHFLPWCGENLFSVFILSIILFLCMFNPLFLGDSIMSPCRLGQRKIWLTEIIPKNPPSRLTLKLLYEGFFSLRVSYFTKVIFSLSCTPLPSPTPLRATSPVL